MSGGDGNYRIHWKPVEPVEPVEPADKSKVKELQRQLDEITQRVREEQYQQTSKDMLKALEQQIMQAPSTREINGGTDLTSWIATTSDNTAGITWDELTTVSKKASETMQKTGLVYEDALEKAREWAKVFRSGKTTGHKTPCLYDGTYDYACTCQPPTAWDRTLLWHCDCCEHPLAPMKYGLCDLCHAHQYDPVDKARADHEAEGLK